MNDYGYDDLLRNYFSLNPKDVKGLNNTSVMYYTKWALKKLFGVYKFDGLPDGWDIDYMKECLFIEGKFCITDTRLGVLPLRCGVSGINVFSHPTDCVIANPVLGSFEKKIDIDCALVKLQYDYIGVMDIINRYAVMLSICDSAIAVNVLNSKVAAVFGAETKAEAESYKRMYDQIAAGKPAVFIGDGLAKKLSERMLFNQVKQQYVADDIEDLKQQIINDFLSDIGIHNANTEKRERMVQNEVMSNRQEVRSGAEHWIENVNEGLNVANRLYGLSLAFKMADWNEGRDEDELTEPAGL